MKLLQKNVWIQRLLLCGIFLLFSTLTIMQRSSTTHFRGFAMKMPYHIAVVGPLSRQNKAIVKHIIEHCFSETDQVANHWNHLSEISHFNQHRSTQPIKISAHMRLLIQLANQIVELSDHRYDPTLGGVIQAWKLSLMQHHEPSQKILLDLSRNIGWQYLHLEPNHQARKGLPELTLDFDAIAKGQTVDQITTHLVEAGFTNVYVEWSGEIRTHGTDEDNEPWKIEIFSPSPGPRDVVQLNNEAIATSGNYMQSWGVRSEIDGGFHLYSHLINKSTLRPTELGRHAVVSVTVRAPTCALADGLATAAMLMETPEELSAWTEKIKNQLQGVTFWIVEKQKL